MLAAAVVGAIVTGLECGVTPSWLLNLTSGVLMGVPSAVATLAALTVAHHALGRRP